MLKTAIEFLRYFIVLLFGALVVVDLRDEAHAENYLVFGCFVILLLPCRLLPMTWVWLLPPKYTSAVSLPVLLYPSLLKTPSLFLCQYVCLLPVLSVSRWITVPQ